MGQTINTVYRRYSGPLKAKPSRMNRHLANSILKYGAENFQIDTIIRCDCLGSLNYWEKCYIQLYNSYDRNFGYNKSYGGSGFIPTSEAIEINRMAQVRYWSDPEARAAQAKRKMVGICSTRDHREKMARVQGSRPFNAYNKITGEFAGTWINKMECGRDLNISGRLVRAVLRKTKRSAKGYVFYYPENEVIFGEELEKLFFKNRSLSHKKLCDNHGT